MPVNSELVPHPPVWLDPATIFSAKQLSLTIKDLLESSLKVQFSLAQESHPLPYDTQMLELEAEYRLIVAITFDHSPTNNYKEVKLTWDGAISSEACALVSSAG